MPKLFHPQLIVILNCRRESIFIEEKIPIDIDGRTMRDNNS